MAGSDNGQTGGIYTSKQCLDEVLFAAILGLAWYNALELVVLCFTRFKRWSDAYFWSLPVASTGIIPYGVGLFLKFFNVAHYNFPSTHTMMSIGWSCMVTGQSMLLWSRLHLLILDPRIIRGTLYLIISDAIILHTSIVVVAFGTNAPRHPTGFTKVYNVLERIQLIGFCVQETILSSLYIWATVKHLRYTPANQYRYILHELLLINVIIILLDGSVVGMQFAGLYAVQITYKALVYSVKLKLEFAILRKLVKVVTTVPHASEERLSESRKQSSGTSEEPKTKQRILRRFPCAGVRPGMLEPSSKPSPEFSRVLSMTTVMFAQNLRSLENPPPAKATR